MGLNQKNKRAVSRILRKIEKFDGVKNRVLKMKLEENISDNIRRGEILDRFNVVTSKKGHKVNFFWKESLKIKKLPTSSRKIRRR